MTAAVLQRRQGQARPVARPVTARPRPPVRPHRPRSRRRLTLAARRLLAFLLTAVVVCLGVWTASALHSEASSDAGLVSATVVVGPGETVWDIAADYVPAGERAHAYVARVLQLNSIDAAAVTPGTVLQLPRS